MLSKIDNAGEETKYIINLNEVTAKNYIARYTKEQVTAMENLINELYKE